MVRFIQNMRVSLAQTSVYSGAIVFASFIMITVSVALFVAIRFLGPKLRLPINRVRPLAERKLSYKKAALSRNTTILVVFFALILLPSLYVGLSAFEALPTSTFNAAITVQGVWGGFWQSLLPQLPSLVRRSYLAWHHNWASGRRLYCS